MNLPKLNTETSFTTITLPSSKDIGIHPWKVKEEKELLFAIDSLAKDDQYEKNAKKETFKFIKTCVDDQKKFDTLSITDILWIAMQLRKLSKGDEIEYEYRCKCGTSTPDVVSISNHGKFKSFEAEPILLEGVKFNLKEVSLPKFTELVEKYSESTSRFNHFFTIASIDSFIYKEEVFTEFTEKDIVEFMDQFSSNSFEKLSESILKATATVELDRSYKCLKCKEMVKVDYGDMFDFLAF